VVGGTSSRDYQEAERWPWLGWRKDGSVAEDLGDMTYDEVTLRMVRLMFVEKEIDLSLRNLTDDWVRRVEERFAGVNGNGARAWALQPFSSLDNPHNFVKDFFATYPASSTQLLASEDKAYFLAISQRRSQKPVPFIPILDSDFEVWFKKVLYGIACYAFTHISHILYLWQAEGIEAVFDQDPQRVCIFQGPVAVKHSKVKDEPIKDLLGNINSTLVDKLVQHIYNGDVGKIP
jgi:fatty acid synthase subunit alpha